MKASTPIVPFAAALCLIACEKSPEAPPQTQGVPPASQTPAQPEWQRALEPTYDAAIEVISEDPPKYAATWTATVNTGGWTMTTESVLVEPPSFGDGMVARVYVILEEPGPGETVTQALETLTGRHETDLPITQIEFSVKRTVRGDTSPWAPLYSVVKNVG